MSSSMKKNRNSNIETFRILSMILVLILHFNAYFLGDMPDIFNINNINSNTIGQVLIEALSSVCVNCFLIISGYFGIKFKYKTFWDMYIMLVMIYVPLYFIECAFYDNFTFKELLRNILALSRKNYYVQCYLMLCFLSPILNSFINKYGKKILKYVLTFWVIEFYFDCLRVGNQYLGFENGYSLIHFVLMYMLGRCTFLYKDAILSINKYFYILGYICCAFAVSLFYIIGIKWSYDYSNPLIIIESFCLFFPFLYKSFNNQFVNWIASSTFAVYIIQLYDLPKLLLCNIDRYLVTNYSYPFYWLIVLIVIICFFLICILYDKIRILLSLKITDKIYHYINMNILKSENIIE